MSNGRKLLVGAVALLVAGGVVFWVLMTGHTKEVPSVASGPVRIEIRAMPVMKIFKNGKQLGTTPLSFQMPASKTPFDLEARWDEQRFALDGKAKIFHFKKVVTVTPDHLQTIDINRKGAEPITEE